MSINEIKNIKKLQQMLKDEMEYRKHNYECCKEAGLELAKNSFQWDGKPKNLVVQVMYLNDKVSRLERERDTLINRYQELDNDYQQEIQFWKSLTPIKYQKAYQVLDKIKDIAQEAYCSGVYTDCSDGLQQILKEIESLEESEKDNESKQSYN